MIYNGTLYFFATLQHVHIFFSVVYTYVHTYSYSKHKFHHADIATSSPPYPTHQPSFHHRNKPLLIRVTIELERILCQSSQAKRAKQAKSVSQPAKEARDRRRTIS